MKILSSQILWLPFLFHLFSLCTSGYYQHPEVVQFTTVPDDAVVCQGCRLEMSCSILRQSTTSDLPQPELEWIFNGSKINEDVRTQTHTTATHVSIDLIIDNAATHHSGIYQCRAMDGNNSAVCRDNSNRQCVPAITISRPARIQIVGDTVTTEAVSIGSSCSGVVVLPCGSRLMQGTSLQTLNLTWRRNGEELTPDLDSELKMLSNGDLVIDATSTDDDAVGLYECVATFNTVGYHNITLARYNVTSLESHSAGSGSWIQGEADRSDYLRLTSSRVVVFEGAGSVEFVCEASVRGEGGVCVPYNVTWRSNDGPLLPATDSDTSLAFNNHLLRVGGVSNSSQYCCQVHATGNRTMEECTTLHVVPQHASPVDSSTIFLGSSEGSGVAEINCSPPYSGAHLYIWYHNSELIDNNTSSSLTVNYSQDSLDAFGVYQCFSVIHPHTMEEIKIIRILPFGVTNSHSHIHLAEVPYPAPDYFGAYNVSWTAPLFTGGLPSLHYNVTVAQNWLAPSVWNTSSHSVVVHIYAYLSANICVTVVSSGINSSFWPQHPRVCQLYEYDDLEQACVGQVLYPPTPSLDCGHGLVSLSWVLSDANSLVFIDGGRENVYANGFCILPNGSVYQFNGGGNFNSPHTFNEATFDVGSRCQFTMASAKACTRTLQDDCFCFDPMRIMYTDPAECVVQGQVEFSAAEVQIFENESSVNVCVRARGYGFVVNASTVELTATAGYNFAPIINHPLHLNSIDVSSSLDQVLCMNISIMDNNVVEERIVQNFTIELSTENDLVTVGQPAIVEIIDDDYTAAMVGFTQSSYNTSEDEGLLQVCASISVELEVNVSVNIQSEDIIAQDDSDYVAVNQTLVFAPDRETTQCFDVSIHDDRIYERSEVFLLSLSPLESAHISLTNSTVLVEILDDEAPRVQFRQSSYTVSESERWLEVCATIDFEFEVEISAAITSHNNTANAGDDYDPVNEIVIFDPERESAQCLNVSINDDEIFEGSESFTLSLSVGDESTPMQATVYILDNEYVTVYFNQSSYTISEGEGPLEVCVAIDEEVGINLHVALSSQDGTAKDDSDYSTVNEVLTFTPEGDSLLCLNISITDDNNFENSEMFTLVLIVTDDYNARVIAAEPATVTILDDDIEHIPLLSNNLSAMAIGISMGVALFLFVLMVSGGISCLVITLHRRHRRGDWNIKQHCETKVEDFDVDFEPPIIIGADTASISQSKTFSEDNFDSRTLLNYLLTRTPSSTELNTAVPHQIQPLTQDYPHDLNTSPTPIVEHSVKTGVHPPVNGYNLSMESGVVMDADHDHVVGRKISDGSNNLSQGSHSYIDIGRTTQITCSCSECKVHREGIQSLQTYNKELSTRLN